MSDVKCPNCNEGVEICHDDGVGYDEGVHKQRCDNCGYEFKFYTSISFSYEVFCSGEHDLESK